MLVFFFCLIRFSALVVSFDLQQSNHITVNAEQCDLFKGSWIPNPSGPIYDNESCAVVEDHQNCMKNGRPDAGYLYWRWKPQDCELPRFNSARFLEAMRNKSWAFIGDSISRNHVQSLLCILSKVRSLFAANSFLFCMHLDLEIVLGNWENQFFNFNSGIKFHSSFLCQFPTLALDV